MALPLYSQASSRVCTRLVRNYRSHEFPEPSKLYYDESLKAHADAKRAKALEQWEELSKGPPALFGVVAAVVRGGEHLVLERRRGLEGGVSFSN